MRTRAVLLFLCLSAGAGVAHEDALAPPPAAEYAGVQPAMAGSEAFARELTRHFRRPGTDAQLVLLDEIEQRLQRAEEIRRGRIPAADKRELDYHRWRAEEALMKWLAASPDVTELNYHAGGAPAGAQRVPLDGQRDLVLLKVVTGEGPPSFFVETWDMTPEEATVPREITIADAATSYVVLKLEHVPADTTFSHLAMREEGAAAAGAWHTFRFEPLPRGQVAIDIRDEQGRPVPALVRIVSHDGGRLREPAGALDFRRQLNDVVYQPIFEPGKGYMFFLPGVRRGHYWIVPKPFEMPLPEGAWDISILHGIEYAPINKTLEVKADTWTRMTFHLKRWVDMPARGWYSGDDHVHARLMNSADAEKLMAYTRAVDIHVANILEMGDVMRTYYAQRGFGPAFRVQHGNHWLVPGQEDPRSMMGHAIGLNLPHMVRDLDRYLFNDWLAGEIHRVGGLYGHTHVGANACFAHREMALFQPMDIVDFNSIMQAWLGTDLYYDFLNLGFKMTASAGADTPYGGTIGAVRVYAYVGRDVPFTPDAWFDALRRGRTFVSNGPVLEFRVDAAMPGDEIVFEEDRQLPVEVTARGCPGVSAPARLRLVRLGETIESVVSDDPARDRLEIRATVPVGHGAWVAAVVDGHDGSQAHTTPVYIRRRGFRHWRPDRVEGLVAKQMAVLDEIEGELAQAEAAMLSGDHARDFWGRTNAAQAEGVRERVAKARAVYRGLRETLKKEKELRNDGNPSSS
jgi:hypothetical protein